MSMDSRINQSGLLEEDDIQFYKGTLLSEEGTNEIWTLDDANANNSFVKSNHGIS